MKTFIARWSNTHQTRGMFVPADSIEHAKQLVLQFDPNAKHIAVEIGKAFMYPSFGKETGT